MPSRRTPPLAAGPDSPVLQVPAVALVSWTSPARPRPPRLHRHRFPADFTGALAVVKLPVTRGHNGHGAVGASRRVLIDVLDLDKLVERSKETLG